MGPTESSYLLGTLRLSTDVGPEFIGLDRLTLMYRVQVTCIADCPIPN